MSLPRKWWWYHKDKANGHDASARWDLLLPLQSSTHLSQLTLAAILFVDDTDIIHINMKKRETINEVHAALVAVASVRSWNNLLMAIGGSLHPAKCFYYMISYYHDHDHNRNHDHNEDEKQRWLYYQDQSESDDCYYYYYYYNIELFVASPDGTPFLMKHHSAEH